MTNRGPCAQTTGHIGRRIARNATQSLLSELGLIPERQRLKADTYDLFPTGICDLVRRRLGDAPRTPAA
ncbi:hypothetical protein FRACA_1370020 [Frankia canadensis]|uniref:Uncharacterized protein n=1 Tax=Frankia canadensis TaxID=1836972 RepID=A0A2I2KL08_9ACTN|nr:hypothetical protein FRACA_1370020 [Frankia canadensis]SOU53651.1 hypothetical protein FRACA_1370020 [Frankia canadensis]